MKVLAIVQSPLQLLCAYEMLCHIPGDYKLILKGNGKEKNDSQMEHAAIELGLRYKKVRTRRNHLYADLLVAAIQCTPLLLRSYEYLFLGDYFSRIFRAVARLLGIKHTYFLDDGVATYLAQIKMRTMGEVSAIATFFDVQPLPGQEVLRHSFNGVRKRFSLDVADGSMFLGQPLVEKGLMSLDSYVSLVRQAVESGDGVLSYFPHRSESQATIDCVSRQAGVEVRNPKTCIELHLLLNRLHPAKVFGGPSSAMFSLSVIFPDVQIYALIPKFENSKTMPHMDDIVSALKLMKNAEILELETSDNC